MTNLTRIAVVPERCSGCLRCALACSFHESAPPTFNVSRSRIQVSPDRDGGFEIAFSEDCVLCGRCIDHCEFGVLTWDGGTS